MAKIGQTAKIIECKQCHMKSDQEIEGEFIDPKTQEQLCPTCYFDRYGYCDRCATCLPIGDMKEGPKHALYCQTCYKIVQEQEAKRVLTIEKCRHVELSFHSIRYMEVTYKAPVNGAYSITSAYCDDEYLEEAVTIKCLNCKKTWTGAIAKEIASKIIKNEFQSGMLPE